MIARHVKERMASLDNYLNKNYDHNIKVIYDINWFSFTDTFPKNIENRNDI
jgi:hypothetical protein